MDSSVKLTLLHRGAEADLFAVELNQWRAILKRRIRKTYRKEELDRNIRSERTSIEAQALHAAKEAGVRTPSLLWITPERYAIGMTFIKGMVARDVLDSFTPAVKGTFFKDVGHQVGLLHQGSIAHGDLTTSNVIVDSNGAAHLIDFGMSMRNPELEDMGVDVHLLARSITTSHTVDSRAFNRSFSAGYSKAAGQIHAQRVLAKARAIARRGRYFAMR